MRRRAPGRPIDILPAHIHRCLPEPAVSAPENRIYQRRGPVYRRNASRAAGRPPTVPSVLSPLLEFYHDNRILSKTSLLLEYIKKYPEASPNSTKIPARALRLFFADEDPADSPLLYVPRRGWFVYNAYWREQGGSILRNSCRRASYRA